MAKVCNIALRAIRVILEKDTVVPSNSPFILEGKLALREKQPDTDIRLIEPLPEATVHLSGLMVGRTLVNPADNSVPVRVLNASDDNVKLYSGTTLAMMYEADNVVVFDDTTLPLRQTSVRKENHLTMLTFRPGQKHFKIFT